MNLDMAAKGVNAKYTVPGNYLLNLAKKNPRINRRLRHTWTISLNLHQTKAHWSLKITKNRL